MEGLVGLWISLGVLGGLGLLALIVGAIQRFKEKFDRNFFLTGTAWGLFLGGILIIFSFLQLEGGGLVGLLTFKDGTLMVGGYEGEYKDGKRHGQGTHTYRGGFQNFSSYERQFMEFDPEDNYHYVGEFKDGKRHGQGTETKNKSQYVGEWKDGKKHGQGAMKMQCALYSHKPTTSDSYEWNMYQIEKMHTLCAEVGRMIEVLPVPVSDASYYFTTHSVGEWSDGVLISLKKPQTTTKGKNSHFTVVDYVTTIDPNPAASWLFYWGVIILTIAGGINIRKSSFWWGTFQNIVQGVVVLGLSAILAVGAVLLGDKIKRKT